MITDISVTQDKVLMDYYKHIDLPIGTIIMNAGNNGSTSFGNAFLLCNGSSQSIASYPELYAIIGTKYGTIGAGSFNLPNFTQKFPMGLPNVGGSVLTNVDPFENPLARQGGNLQIQSNQFLHGHASVTYVLGVNSLGLTGDIDDESPYWTTSTQLTFPSSDLDITESPVNNLPLYYTLNYFIYTGKGNIGQV
jgi:microcystin-dependent protein